MDSVVAEARPGAVLLHEEELQQVQDASGAGSGTVAAEEAAAPPQQGDEGLRGRSGPGEEEAGGLAQTVKGPTAAVLLQSVTVFLLAGLCEIGGGWLVWRWLREGKPAWQGVLGGLALAGYGVVATWQPAGLDFGRVYAAYGGYFIVLSLLWGVYVDKSLDMDRGDWLGSALCIAGALVICFWPRA